MMENLDDLGHDGGAVMRLLPQHQQLIDASGISPAVAAARGYRSITSAKEAIALGFADYQARVPALLSPVHGVDGRIALHQLRPDDPRTKNGRALKYETPAGSRMVIDVPPAVRPVLGDPSVPLLITEGCRKADSATSHGGHCIALLGVYNFRGKNALGGKVILSDWEAIALNGRDVAIAYDSDVMTNRNVRGALDRLTAFLRSRGARVRHVYLPALDGGKCGLDDFLAAGHTLADVYALAREPDAAPADAPPDAWTPRIISLADVQPERVRWLWRGRIALGKINLLDGDPGLGKSTITHDIAARVSTGHPMPDGTMGDLHGPAGVVILSAEDGMADTIRPRLDADDADVTRIVAIEAMEHDGKERGVTLADLPAIESAIAAVDAKLVIIDPLMAYLGSDTNSHRDQDVRGVLAPLARLAERTSVAVVLIRHLSKAAQANVLYRGGGSIGIIAAVRVALAVGRDPDDATGERRVLAVQKNNLAKFAPALAFHTEEHPNGAARIVWEGVTHHTAAAITATMPQDDGERTALDEAKEILRTILADGPVEADRVKAEARQAGVSEMSLRRAKSDLGVTAKKTGFGASGRWIWELNESSTAVHETPKMLSETLRRSTEKGEHLSEPMSTLAEEDTWETLPDAIAGEREETRV